MSLVLDDDEYPPYPEDRRDRMIATLESGLARNRRAYFREVVTILAAGICAGLAIAGLLVVYGVF